MAAALAACVFARPSSARERWTELNIGPFYVYTEGNEAAAREDLTQCEQLRWVLGGLLEIQDLRSVWPIRIVLTKHASETPGQFVQQNGQFLLLLDPGSKVPLGELAKLLLDQNTPHIPAEAEDGLRVLFSTLQAHGSRVEWGGPPPSSAGAAPNLAFARMQLFATKFEYRASLHVLVTSLKNGSSLRVAERNAFGRDPDVLDKEAEANLKAAQWAPVSVSGRPLDPKRDFGEHSADTPEVDIYLADAQSDKNPRAAEAAYKAGIEAGGAARGLGYAGLASLTAREKGDPKPFLDAALKAGDSSAYILTLAAESKPAAEALPLLKRAAQLNPMWAQPIYDQVQFAPDPAEKESLLKKAAAVEPRNTRYWLELAQLQANDGHAIEAQSSWLRAEDSALDSAERDRIRKLHEQSEQVRLDAADRERVDEREAAHRDDLRAQAAEAARIRAAEEKANQRPAPAGNSAAPQKVVPWEEMVQKKKLAGVLVDVQCGRQNARVAIRDKSGKTIQLSLRDWKTAGLSCGMQKQSQRVLVSYAVEPDEQNQTAGRIVSLQMQ